jgi:hypothetical protein
MVQMISMMALTKIASTFIPSTISSKEAIFHEEIEAKGDSIACLNPHG